jgi:RecB family exonuclease
VSCRVPTTFSPSQLAFGDQCLLRAILGSDRSLPTLTAHPAAALGSVFHKLLELAVRGEIPRSGTPGEDAQRALDRLLDAQDALIGAAWPSDPPKLRELFPPLTWRRKRRVVLDLAEKYLSGAVARVATGTGVGTRNAKDLPLNGSWAEVQIEAPALRLRGRADLVERRDGDVVIRDLKTGRVIDRDGEVLPHIERQMRLYGAMAHVVWPSSNVSLIVDHGVEREVGFADAHETEVLAWLRTILARLPPDTDVSVEAVATPSDACEGCAHRHLCPAYRRTAPECWRGESSIRLPLDTWGQVVAFVKRDQGLVDLTIRDAAGRMVKIFGLAMFRVGGLMPGDEVWLFGLRTRDRRGGPEAWRHPHNFFEVADDDPYGRAWTLESFTAAVRSERGEEHGIC